jgi:hypothetical protein
MTERFRFLSDLGMGNVGSSDLGTRTLTIIVKPFRILMPPFEVITIFPV